VEAKMRSATLRANIIIVAAPEKKGTANGGIA
jgi:hypothetical protein